MGLGVRSGQKAGILPVYLLLPPGGRNWAYFRSMMSGLGVTGHFNFLPYMGIEVRSGQKAGILSAYLLLPPEGRNWAYFRSTMSGLGVTGHFIFLPYMA